jgi:hypothetical protein
VDDKLTSTLALPQASVSPTCILTVFKMLGAAGAPVGSSNAVIHELTLATSAINMTSMNGNTINRPYAAGTWYRMRQDFSNQAGDIFQIGSSSTAANAGDSATLGTGRNIGNRATVNFCNATFWEVIYLNKIPSAGEMTAYDAYITAATAGAVQV